MLRLGVARLVWFPGHLLVSVAALLVSLFRRHRVLVFDHWPDVDRDGRNRQMGPLLDALQDRHDLVEVTLVPSRDLLECLLGKRRGFVSLAAVYGPARVLATLLPGDRMGYSVMLGRWLLRWLRPRCVVLIDESGSGQFLLRAARQLGIPVIGIQHGDFQPDNPQYASRFTEPRRIEPADVLCVWSPWFRERLRRVSNLYGDHNVAITGRLRYPIGSEHTADAHDLAPRTSRDANAPTTTGPARRRRVLVISENDRDFGDTVRPYLDAVRSEGAFVVKVRPHPAEPAGSWSPEEILNADLDRCLAWADIVLGVRSSALLEALAQDCIALRLDPTPSSAAASTKDADRASPVPACSDPRELVELCRNPTALAASTRQGRDRVWGDAPTDPLASVLGVLDEHGK